MVNNSIADRNFLRGSLAALVTPMDIKGQIDKPSLKN